MLVAAPATSVGAAVILFAAIFASRQLHGAVGDGLTLLYALPIALLALRFGLWAGLAAGVLAGVLFVVYASGVDFAPLAYSTRTIVFLTLGFSLGGYADKLRRSEQGLRAVIARLEDAEEERTRLVGELEALSRTDPLTGAANRRHFDVQLDRELDASRIHGRPVTLAMLDLDRFKVFNDSQGHLAGDRLLKAVTAIWRAALRTTDTLARYGGEEFAAILPGCDEADAVLLAERMRSAVPSDQTCSVGIATWDGTETADELVGRADAALYEAKQSGRDRVLVN